MNFLASKAVAVVLLLLFSAAAAGTEVLRLQVDTDVASAGYFQLRWQADGPVRLLESVSADFPSPTELYSGTDRASHQSGRPNGDFFFRIDSIDGSARSEVLRVRVRHHSLGRAGWFFALGATVFLATLALIVIGSRRESG